ncbi:MAG TPA: hypothetical protein VFE51_26995 [Verrucomicrobiae bacterium]|nr:hypothetical protein [Verrucomicrobiae bacterium]
MENKPQFTRPPFEQAQRAWEEVLRQRGLPTELIWVFEENLCLEPQSSDSRGYRIGYQVVWTPPPSEAQHIAYDHFSEFDAPLVWYRLGTSRGKSICLLLCDAWFNEKSEAEGFIKRPEWHMLFRPGPTEEIEEIKEKARWEKRLVRERPLKELDFGMTLRAIHEVLAHGRVLTPYERYALRLLHVWRHWLGDKTA